MTLAARAVSSPRSPPRKASPISGPPRLTDVLGEITDEPIATLLTPGVQLGFGNFYLGVAQGALA
ncbi:hypothetical protein ACX8Z9_13270 [Arthrobacter halodurans]|uniref:Uncharacterized protein n=1 Tax=Arthrobacter halodurans TaxID=516699 RepID=A0ABV4UUX7_9MICC